MKHVALVMVVVAACSPGPRQGQNGDDVDAHQASTDGDNSGDAGGTTYVYAHTDSTLFRVDPDTLAITQVGDFVWPASVISDQMTDIAIDKNGTIIGVSFDKVYKIDPSTAVTTLLSSNLGNSFNGLSYVPATMLGETGDDVLIGTRNTDGVVFRVDPMTGATTQVGNMGAYMSSGDLVAVAGFGTVQTVVGASDDQLANLAPQTFAATIVGNGDTGYGEIWGLAFWKGKIYGFTEGGQFILIDPTTGVATLVSTNGQAWWGAGVTTLAPTIE